MVKVETSLAVQWLRLLSMQRVQVQSLAEKLRSYMLCSQKLKQINKFKSKIFSKIR